jgi:hypothetical protein
MYEIEYNLIFYLEILEMSKDFFICRYKTMKETSLHNKYTSVVAFHMYLISLWNTKMENHLIFYEDF